MTARGDVSAARTDANLVNKMDNSLPARQLHAGLRGEAREGWAQSKWAVLLAAQGWNGCDLDSLVNNLQNGSQYQSQMPRAARALGTGIVTLSSRRTRPAGVKAQGSRAIRNNCNSTSDIARQPQHGCCCAAFLLQDEAELWAARHDA